MTYIGTEVSRGEGEGFSHVVDATKLIKGDIVTYIGSRDSEFTEIVGTFNNFYKSEDYVELYVNEKKVTINRFMIIKVHRVGSKIFDMDEVKEDKGGLSTITNSFSFVKSEDEITTKEPMKGYTEWVPLYNGATARVSNVGADNYLVEVLCDKVEKISRNEYDLIIGYQKLEMNHSTKLNDKSSVKEFLMDFISGEFVFLGEGPNKHIYFTMLSVMKEPSFNWGQFKEYYRYETRFRTEQEGKDFLYYIGDKFNLSDRHYANLSRSISMILNQNID